MDSSTYAACLPNILTVMALSFLGRQYTRQYTRQYGSYRSILLFPHIFGFRWQSSGGVRAGEGKKRRTLPSRHVDYVRMTNSFELGQHCVKCYCHLFTPRLSTYPKKAHVYFPREKKGTHQSLSTNCRKWKMSARYSECI